MADQEGDADPFEKTRRKTIADREGGYQARGRQARRELSPERRDAFADGDKGGEQRSYAEVMQEHELERERQALQEKLQQMERDHPGSTTEQQPQLPPATSTERRKRRWDVQAPPSPQSAAKPVRRSEWEDEEDAGGKPQQPQQAKTKRSRWDETPALPSGLSGDATPAAGADSTARRRSRWDETPVAGGGASQQQQQQLVGSTPLAGGKTSGRGSRWDETPVAGGAQQTPSASAAAASSMMTPLPGGVYSHAGGAPVMTAELAATMRMEREMEHRNRPLSDEELDAVLPAAGYKLLEAPATYQPIRTPSRKLMATPTPLGGGGGFYMQEGSAAGLAGGAAAAEGYEIALPDHGGLAMPSMKPEDVQYFGKLMEQKPDEEISPEEAKERKIMRLLLKIKNGTPQMRKVSLRQISERARDFGAGALFNQILPLLMSPTLEDMERHLLVKVVDRILFRLDELVRPFVHKILVVIEPLLIDEDFFARIEGREIISNLSKAAGLATMISVMRPDIDHADEYVRNTTARAFSVVASALGIPALLPFLKAVCRSKKSWQARHTGIRIVQQIAILMGCAVLPHLRGLVECIGHGLQDDQHKVRTMTALAIAALAEASAPYGIESFESVLKPLWQGTREHRGKGLAAILKAIGYIIPLMDAEYGAYYTRDVMTVLVKQFTTPDDEMKKIVLKVVKQCAETEGVTGDELRRVVLDEYFVHFWNRRLALDRRNYRQLVETTVELANKVGVSEILGRVATTLKDEAEPFRKMAVEVIEKVATNLGVADVDEALEKAVIDGLVFCFQELSQEEHSILDGFGSIVNVFGTRVKPYLSQISSVILWRLNNKTAKVRQQAAELISRIATVLNECDEESVLSHLGVVLYEYLGEEYPDVLGSILGALKAIVNVIGMTKMQPPIKDLLPRLTPILKNRHEKVQENCIDLVGRIADRGADFVAAREWMRICFDLLELLKAHKKGIRRASVNTFGYIAKAIGPQDVLGTLLNNLKVQERQNRVCTTVAIAIVAETCSPFTVLPALMNEYRVPELNVQNGVLKSLSFLFEYIGEMGKDYVYAVAPLLEDALTDRDQVHRQTACATIKHMSLGVAGLGCEDAMLHLLNLVWPNIFEASPHVINAVMEAVDGLRMALGPGVITSYALQGLFHPARKVREAYWKIWNAMYICHQDSMAAYYPRVVASQGDEDVYTRREMDYVL